MNAWLTHQRAALAQALRRLAGTPTTTLLAAISIGIALSLPAGGHLLLTSLQQLGQGSSANPQISVFMTLDADAKASEKVGEQLKVNPAVGAAQFIGRETTQKRLREAGLAQVIDSLPRNPFPDTFVVTPADSSPEALEALRAELAKLPHVDQVQVDSAWAKRLSVLLNLGRTVVWLLAGLFGIGLIALVFNTIRLQVLTKREEIEVSRLLGATDTYIGRPFYYFGALQGLLGGLLACAIVFASFAILQARVAELAELYRMGFELHQLKLTDILALLGLSAALGWLGAALSVRQHLRDF
ncbi:MAG: permease-like cell division protein FtsX [Rhodocyclaceae bacterium]|nr:permease-like cell division protein FtsX [Rhodocyclaceae bacterium]